MNLINMHRRSKHKQKHLTNKDVLLIIQSVRFIMIMLEKQNFFLSHFLNDSHAHNVVLATCAVMSEDLTNDTHSLAHVVEVQYGQQLVGDSSSYFTQCDGLWGSGPEDKPKVSRCGDQGSLVRWLGLVHQISFMLTETLIRQCFDILSNFCSDLDDVIECACSLPSLLSSGMTVWHKASSLKNSCTAQSSSLMASTRLPS